MIPMLAIVQTRRPPRALRLWVPLFLVWIVLLPLIVLLLPVSCIAAWLLGMRPLRALGVLFRVANALPGTRVEIDRCSSSVVIRIL